jgi:hypothetical protein
VPRSNARWSNKIPGVVRPTLLYVNPEAVIPVKAGIQFRKTGFRVKPGMTANVKGPRLPGKIRIE